MPLGVCGVQERTNQLQLPPNAPGACHVFNLLPLVAKAFQAPNNKDTLRQSKRRNGPRTRPPGVYSYADLWEARKVVEGKTPAAFKLRTAWAFRAFHACSLFCPNALTDVNSALDGLDRACRYWRETGECKGREDGRCVQEHDPEYRALEGDARMPCEAFANGQCPNTAASCDNKHDPDVHQRRAGATAVDIADAIQAPCKLWRERGFCTARNTGACPGTHLRDDRGAISDFRATCRDWERNECPRTELECNFLHGDRSGAGPAASGSRASSTPTSVDSPAVAAGDVRRDRVSAVTRARHEQHQPSQAWTVLSAAPVARSPAFSVSDRAAAMGPTLMGATPWARSRRRAPHDTGAPYATATPAPNNESDAPVIGGATHLHVGGDHVTVCEKWLRDACSEAACGHAHPRDRWGEEAPYHCADWRWRGYCVGRTSRECGLEHLNEDRALFGDQRTDCRHWLQGHCARSDYDCDFKHDPELKGIDATAPDDGGSISCPNWRRSGYCRGRRNGQCFYEHDPADRGVDGSDERKDCRHWLRDGRCPVGDDCDFKHDAKRVAERQDERADCVHWKRGKCRKSDAECPYRHHPDKRGTATPEERACEFWKLRGYCSKHSDGTCTYEHKFKFWAVEADLREDCRYGATCVRDRDGLCPFRHPNDWRTKKRRNDLLRAQEKQKRGKLPAQAQAGAGKTRAGGNGHKRVSTRNSFGALCDSDSSDGE